MPVAAFDLVSAEWVIGEVDWSCGPRHSVAYTGTEADGGAEPRSIIFYGGRIADHVVGGLYLKSLAPEDLFDGSDVTWLDQVVTEAGLATPGERADAVLAYEPQNKLVYLFGGTDADGTTRNDLWVFSRTTNTWTQLSTGEDPTAPPATLPGGLAISPLDGSVILIGGAYSAAHQGGVWRWINNRWKAERLPQDG